MSTTNIGMVECECRAEVDLEHSIKEATIPVPDNKVEIHEYISSDSG